MAESKHTILKSLFALLIAVVAWTYVVYNYDPMTKVTYTDIPIRFIGEDVLADKGYGIKSVSNEEISVELNQRRVETTKISSEDIKVTADVSEAVEGKNGISLEITSPEGTQVVNSDINAVSIDVEEADRIELDIAVEYLDSPESNAEPIATKLTSTTATVIGAKSILKNADKAIAYLDFSDMSNGPGTFTRDLVAVDTSGEVIPHTVIYPDSVNFNAELGYTKYVQLNLKTKDDSDDDYERTCSGPDRILIKCKADLLSDITSIDTEEIDMTYIYEDTDMDIAYQFPEGVSLANDSTDQQARIKVVKKEKTKDTAEDNHN